MKESKLRLGIIGMSEGNGHPYSWSAIFNGYEKIYMSECPFPAIPEYLRKEVFPDNFLTELAEVTHIWTQDIEISTHIAKAAKIKEVVSDLEDMIGQVDAVLLARDDAQNHLKLAIPFLERGIPIYIDKPIALKPEDAELLFSKQLFFGQLFTCSALRYAKELFLNEEDKERIGSIIRIDAYTPKSWEKYAIHLIEPLVSAYDLKQQPISHQCTYTDDQCTLNLLYDGGLQVGIHTLGKCNHPIILRIIGAKHTIEKKFTDSFYAFKSALAHFIEAVMQKKYLIDPSETEHIVKLISLGKNLD